jgi:photosystem II stability/assembly factor-like uncharacterized protein
MAPLFNYKISLLFFLLFFSFQSFSQKRKKSTSVPTVKYDEALYKGMEYRLVGSFRGGRASSVTGVIGKPNLFYMGATGGGVWKTQDGGQSWNNISDGYFGGSIGAVAVSDSDPNVLYVGTGEKTVRGNVSPGFGGMFKSYDAGKTWENIGLPNAGQIGQIRIHPKDPDIVFVAVMGSLFADSKERGVYKSEDGGKSWRKVLYANAKAGAVDITFEPGNARVLYASTWNIRRTPFSLSSGGDGSGLWKSTDMGETWKNISKNKGLPEGVIGIIGVSVSPVNPNIVYALIESEKGGLFRSENAGATWKLVSEDRNLRQRAWYYTKVFADTQLEDRVYIMNVQFWQSNDGGKNFKSYDTPHGDHHDLWIAPEDNNRLVVGDDGGAQVSYDAGKNWSTYLNQPTAQYYRVTTDNSFPYRIYVAQQDNSTQRILHRTAGNSISPRDWESSAGGESAHLAIDPLNNDIVYGGSYDGFLTRKNHKTGEQRLINVWPDNPMGHGAEDMKYRFQWNFPIFFSPHNPKKLYTTSNQVHVTYNEGQSWEIISPDLTRGEPEKLVSSGGPITQDNTAVEYYATIFAATESPYEKDLIWAASDDGLVHMTKDGGKNWENVTPAIAPKYLMYNSVEPDPFVKGGVYLAGTLYKGGDFKPYMFKSKDYGKTWTKIVNGIPNNYFTRVLRADPVRKGLLYAGTESGMFISFDDGTSWNKFQLNLPLTPITDLAIKENNLVVATQGRSAWVIDDLTVLQQLESDVKSKAVHLFKPIDSYRTNGAASTKKPKQAGQNHHNGVMFYYHLANEVPKDQEITMDIMENDGTIIKTITSKPKEKGDTLKIEKGSNKFYWNMRYPDADGFKGLIMWAANLTGPRAIPGTYKAKLNYGENTSETEFVILADPRISATQEDMVAQFKFVQSTNQKVGLMHREIKSIRKVRDQIKDLTDKLGEEDQYEEIKKLSETILEEMKTIEESLYQTKNKSSQDPLNYPIRLNNKLAHLKGQANFGDDRPTDQAQDLKSELEAEIDGHLNKWGKLQSESIPEFNKKVKDMNIDAIMIKKEEGAF